MTALPIMDAGPGLNFFSLNKERMLFEALGPLRVPETVHTEMIRKAQNDQRFARSQNVLGKLPDALLEVLSDDATGPLRESFERLAHAAFQAVQGHDVTTLTVLERSVAGPHLPDPAALRKLYGRMRSLDDGLLPLERTGLLSAPGWSPTR